MIKIVHFADNEYAIAEINKTGVRNRQAVRQFFFAYAKDLVASTRHDVLKGRKYGRVYYNVRLPGGGIKRRHRASSPRQTHANLSGNMLRALGFKVHGIESMEFGYGTGWDDPAPIYSQYVIEGTANAHAGGGGMKPRPDLKNAIRKNQGNARSHWKAAVLKTGGYTPIQV